MNKLIVIAAVSLLITGCSYKPEMTYKNDMSAKSWGLEPTSNIVKDFKAPSAPFVCKIDSSAPYSPTFNMRVSEISEETLTKVTLSAWIKVDDLRATPDLVVDIRDKNDQSMEWLAHTIYLSKAHKWIKQEVTVNLKERNRNNKQNFIRVYVSNGKSIPASVDDIEIKFETK